MILTQNLSSTTTFRTDTAERANAILVTNPKSVASATVPITFYDSSVYENTSAIVWNEFEILQEIGLDLPIENLSSTQTLLANIVAPIGNGGSGRVRIIDGTIKKYFLTDTTKYSGQAWRTFISYTAGTVSKYLFDQVSALFVALPNTAYYLSYNHSTASYIRNPACWLASINLSCVAVASNTGSGWTRQRGGTLIAPRIIIIARHFNYGVGTQVRFSNAVGTVETFTVIAVDSASSGDISICVLNAPVTIATPCKIAGNWIIQGTTISSLTKKWFSGGIAFYIDQNAQVYACSIGQTLFLSESPFTTIDANGSSFENCETTGTVIHTTEVIGAENAALLKTPVPGDSGQPVFVIISGQPVLLWCWYFPHGGPPTYRYNGALLNAIIASACVNAGIAAQTVTVATSPI